MFKAVADGIVFVGVLLPPKVLPTEVSMLEFYSTKGVAEGSVCPTPNAMLMSRAAFTRRTVQKVGEAQREAENVQSSQKILKV